MYDWARQFATRLDEMEELLSGNRIWKERTVDVGVISAQQAWDWGCSGPLLRGSGIDWDLRKQQPYDAYGKMEFNVPIAGHGDCYDRYLVRLQEMRESLHIIYQVMAWAGLGEGEGSGKRLGLGGGFGGPWGRSGGQQST